MLFHVSQHISIGITESDYLGMINNNRSLFLRERKTQYVKAILCVKWSFFYVIKWHMSSLSLFFPTH